MFDPTLIINNFISVSDDQLNSEITRYREHCLNNFEALQQETASSSNGLRLFTGSKPPELKILKQAALYLDTVVIADPLFPHSESFGEMAQAMNSVLPMPAHRGPDRIGITRAVKMLRQCRPMIATGYLKIFPATFLGEVPTKIPVRYSPTAFVELLRPSILSKYRAAAKVVSLKQTSQGLEFLHELNPCRVIAIEFENQSTSDTFIYTLLEQKILKFNEQDGTAEFEMNLPTSPPEQAHFDQWINQSINQAAAQHFNSLSRDLAIAASSGCSYLTSSPFSSEILQATPTNPTDKRSIQSCTVDAVLRLELQAFDDISIEDLMSARADSQALALFRIELEKSFRELRKETDPEKLRNKLEDATHELTEVQLTRVSQAISNLRKRLLADATIVVAGLSSTIVTAGYGLFAGITAAALGYKHYVDYRKSIHESPAYFLWKAGLRK